MRRGKESEYYVLKKIFPDLMGKKCYVIVFICIWELIVRRNVFYVLVPDNMWLLEAGNNGGPIAPLPEWSLAKWYSAARKRENKQVDFLNFPQALGSRHLRSGAEAVFRTWPRFGAELCHREVWQRAPQWVRKPRGRRDPCRTGGSSLPPKNSQSFSWNPASLLFRSVH